MISLKGGEDTRGGYLGGTSDNLLALDGPPFHADGADDAQGRESGAHGVGLCQGVVVCDEHLGQVLCGDDVFQVCGARAEDEAGVEVRDAGDEA